jgi:hypothetical protein
VARECCRNLGNLPRWPGAIDFDAIADHWLAAVLRLLAAGGEPRFVKISDLGEVD